MAYDFIQNGLLVPTSFSLDLFKPLQRVYPHDTH